MSEPNNTRQTRRRRANLEARAPKLTKQSLQQTLTEILKDARKDIPQGASLAILEANLQSQRILFEIEFQNPEGYQINKDTQDASATLLRNLPLFRKRIAEAVTFLEKHAEIIGGDENATSYELEQYAPVRAELAAFKEADAAGNRLIEDLERIKAPSKWFAPLPNNPEFVESWPAILPKLIQIFTHAMPDIGQGNTRGTLNRCLAAVIPSITGETPTPDQIYDVRRQKG